MIEENFKGTTKFFNNLLVASIDDKNTVWIVEQNSETLDKTVIEIDEENTKALGEWLIKVSEKNQ